jgi:hypothetical protein
MHLPYPKVSIGFKTEWAAHRKATTPLSTLFCTG